MQTFMLEGSQKDYIVEKFTFPVSLSKEKLGLVRFSDVCFLLINFDMNCALQYFLC